VVTTLYVATEPGSLLMSSCGSSHCKRSSRVMPPILLELAQVQNSAAMHEDAADAGDRLSRRLNRGGCCTRGWAHQGMDRQERIGAIVHETARDEPTPMRCACLPPHVSQRTRLTLANAAAI
jgi:hypothetical protein